MGTASCKKWLDVKPKSQIESGVNFQDEQGFRDALTGVYVNMSSAKLYGQEMSFGFMDVLGLQYSQYISSQRYFNTVDYDYRFPEAVNRIREIWKGMYFSIVNVNNLLDHLAKADSTMFTGPNYRIIKGEAYALRAFHHFDLLRVFSPAPASPGGNDAISVPWRDRIVNGNVPQTKVSEILVKIINDLEIASEQLRTVDPIVPGSSTPVTTTGFLRDRHYRLNYFAVRALMARVYLYAGNHAKALECATEVITSGKYTPVIPGNASYGDKTFSPEVIFNIFNNNLNTVYTSTFAVVPGFSSGMTKNQATWNTVFETSTIGALDIRYMYQTALTNGVRTIEKLNPAANNLASFRMPLIRLHEMYLIAAEATKATDTETAIGYLNTARRNRSLPALQLTLDATQVQAEIFKEYQKEFICEGQLFYYYKRTNAATIEFTTVPGGPDVYLVPMPDDEIEYGNVK